jgi:hypothetical protein
MFHKWHCIARLLTRCFPRDLLILTKNPIRVHSDTLEGYINETEAEMHQKKRNVFANESYVNHCFNYLRQAIMYAGGLSMEHSMVPNEFDFNGCDTVHQCGDWDVMWDIAVERYHHPIPWTVNYRILLELEKKARREVE